MSFNSEYVVENDSLSPQDWTVSLAPPPLSHNDGDNNNESNNKVAVVNLATGEQRWLQLVGHHW